MIKPSIFCLTLLAFSLVKVSAEQMPPLPSGPKGPGSFGAFHNQNGAPGSRNEFVNRFPHDPKF